MDHTPALWPYWMAFAGLLNIFAQAPQLWQMYKTRTSAGISIPMFGIYAVLQITFGLNGLFLDDMRMVWIMALSLVVNLATMTYAAALRKRPTI